MSAQARAFQRNKSREIYDQLHDSFHDQLHDSCHATCKARLHAARAAALSQSSSIRPLPLMRSTRAASRASRGSVDEHGRACEDAHYDAAYDLWGHKGAQVAHRDNRGAHVAHRTPRAIACSCSDGHRVCVERALTSEAATRTQLSSRTPCSAHEALLSLSRLL